MFISSRRTFFKIFLYMITELNMLIDIPTLRNIPIRKTLNLQAVSMQPLFLIKASHNGEIGEDHQQTILKRYLISAPNEQLAKHYFTLNIINTIEDLSLYNEFDLSNVFQTFNHLFLRNDNHISLDSKTSGYKVFSTENIFIKQVKQIYFNNCIGYLNHNKIIDANFDLAEFKKLVDTQYNSHERFESRTQINVSMMGSQHNVEQHQSQFANLVANSLSQQAKTAETQIPVKKEVFAELFANSQATPNTEDENRWNREEFNRSAHPQFGNRYHRNNIAKQEHPQGSQYLRKTHNFHPDAEQQKSNNWLNTTSHPVQVTQHKPFKSLIQKDN